MASKRKYTIEQLAEAVKSSQSMRQVLVKIGLNPTGGGSAKVIKGIIKRENIDDSHLLGKGWLKGKKNPNGFKMRFPAEKIFVQSSLYRGASIKLKERFIERFNVPYKCLRCDLNEWQGKKIILHIDHINGVNDDNRQENLRLLCPNCHSQTDTYCGRNAYKGM
jgi:Zn finger protein HypA/HybF involved in hydrogenase expression